MGEELGPAAAYSAQVKEITIVMNLRSHSPPAGGCLAEPSLPCSDDSDWIPKLSCISSKPGQTWVPGNFMISAKYFSHPF